MAPEYTDQQKAALDALRAAFGDRGDGTIPCFVLRHSAWNNARVFLGHNAEEQAKEAMREAYPDDEPGEFDRRFENDECDEFDVFGDALIY